MSRVVNVKFELCRRDAFGLFEVVGVFYDVNMAYEAGRMLSCKFKEDLHIIQSLTGYVASSEPLLHINWQREYKILSLGVL